MAHSLTQTVRIVTGTLLILSGILLPAIMGGAA